MPTTDASPALDPMALLQAFGGGGDPASAILQQLAGGASDDPRLALVSRLLDQRKPPEPDLDQIEVERAERRAEEMRALSEMVEKMYRELERLRGRNVQLADALGACPACFGSDLLCRRCGGKGRPGGRAPDPAAFGVYVAPALARMRRSTTAASVCDPKGLPFPPGASPLESHFNNVSREISDERELRV